MPTFHEYITRNGKPMPFARPEPAKPTGIDRPLLHRPKPVQSKQEREVFAALSYAFGLTSTRPGVTMLNADPDRLRGFAQRWLAQHNLELVKR